MARYPKSERSDADLTGKEKTDYPTSEEEIEKALQRAREYREEGEYRSGINLLIDALKSGKLKDRIYYRLGNIYFDKQDLGKAERAYEKAIDLNENHVNAQHNLAVVYNEQGKIRESIRQRKKAQKVEIENPPDDDLTENQRARLRRVAWRVLRYLAAGVALAGVGVYLAFRFL